MDLVPSTSMPAHPLIFPGSKSCVPPPATGVLQSMEVGHPGITGAPAQRLVGMEFIQEQELVPIPLHPMEEQNVWVPVKTVKSAWIKNAS